MAGSWASALRRASIAVLLLAAIGWWQGELLLFLFLGGWIPIPFYLAMLLWAAYLLYRLFQRKRAGDAFRYAIPVSVVIWSLAEVGAFFGIYSEFWQSPVEHPLSNAVLVALFVGCLVPLLKTAPARK